MRRSRLLGLLAAVAVVAAAVTWAVLAFAVNTGTETAARSASVPSAEQAAAFGREGAVLDALGLGPREKEYVQGITSLTPVEQAAAFGREGAVLDALGLGPREKEYVQGITSLTPVERAPAFGGPGATLDAFRFGSEFKRFVEGIASMTKAQQQAVSSK